ncbi:MAG: co-chaperone DjlA [Gammaproteobacteria bacterium]|nr:co-chaperone DjlA [Gammaproteobacteria bacterium]
MLHRGKILSIFIGYFLWGIPGALIGLLVGYVTDKSLLALQKPRYVKATSHALSGLDKEYWVITFKIMGYIAYAGGRESDDEAILVSLAFDYLQPLQIDQSQALCFFNVGQQPDFDMDDALLIFLGAYRDQPDLIEMFVELQIYAINKEGKITSSEKRVLLKICHLLGLTKADFDRIYYPVRVEQQLKHSRQRDKNDAKNKAKLANAYTVLKTSPNASDDEIKRAYRQLRSVHHPDKLVAQNLSVEMLKVAEDKTHEIRAAYEAIKVVRNL